MYFELNKNNYKELEYLINEYIHKRKAIHLERFPTKKYGVDISFVYKGVMSSYSDIDSVELVEWNMGIKIDVYSNQLKSSFLYRNDEEVYAKVKLGALGGGTCLEDGTWYHSDSIGFYTL